jgi:hypothetical protein
MVIGIDPFTAGLKNGVSIPNGVAPPANTVPRFKQCRLMPEIV